MAAARTLTPHTPSLLVAYKAKLAEGGYVADAAHVRVVTRLEHLLQALGADTATPPMGVYLYGPVGRGKSWLMNLFFESVTLPKRRVHFHAFMQELHTRMHHMVTKPGQDLMQLVAADVAAECAVLCFDEFYITNIADAMLLGRLMEALFKQGVVVVATSNWGMEDLFQGGVNRDRFMPFIKTLQKYLEPLDIGEGRDYRQDTRAKPSDVPAYYIVAGREAVTPQLQMLFEQFAVGVAAPLPADMVAKRQVGRACWFTFAELCEKFLGREHFLELVRVCDTVVLEGVPELTTRDANVALRLIALIDILYEHKKRLVMSAATSPEHLCVAGDAAEPFKRTASRMRQLTQSDWVEREHATPESTPVVKLHTRKSQAAQPRRKR
ncbi:MAG: cell division protein ZapE [Alphaproteobacteria bacterium]